MEIPAEQYTNLKNFNQTNIETEYEKIKGQRTDSFIMRYYKSKFNKIRNLTTNFINKMSRDEIRNNMMGEHIDLLHELDDCFENLENQLNKIKYKINNSLNVNQNISKDKIEKFETNDLQNKVIKDLMPLAFYYFNLLNTNNSISDNTNTDNTNTNNANADNTNSDNNEKESSNENNDLNEVLSNINNKYPITELMKEFEKNNFFSSFNNNFFNNSEINENIKEEPKSVFDIDGVD